jgi:CheY-like chemotaxis protein
VEAGRQATLLLVDDDDGAREILGLHLRRMGFRVLEAADGVEALRVVADHQGQIDALISDVQMPRLDGLELVKRLHTLQPQIRVVLISANPDHLPRIEGSAPTVLPKLGFDSLARAVRGSLGWR